MSAPLQLESFSTPVNALVQGASRGIGLALVERLAACPQVVSVHATSRCPETAAPLAGLLARYPDKVRRLVLDVTVEATIAAACKQMAKSVGTLDLIINCAGLLHGEANVWPERSLDDVQPEQMVAGFRVNALGPLLVAKHAQPLLSRDRRVVLATLSARVGSIGDNRLGGWYGYRGSKAAQNMFTRNLSIELRRRHRRIICVALHPGTVDTELSEPFRRSVRPEALFSTARAAAQLLSVIDGLRDADNGSFVAWDGQRIDW